MQRQRVQHTTLSGPSMILDFLLLMPVHDFVIQLKLSAGLDPSSAAAFDLLLAEHGTS